MNPMVIARGDTAAATSPPISTRIFVDSSSSSSSSSSSCSSSIVSPWARVTVTEEVLLFVGISGITTRCCILTTT